MEALELGQATIVYEDPDEGIVEETVDNEELVYAYDHWNIRSGSDDDGNDLMKQIPRDRVHRVDRNVEKFEEQAGTVRKRVESLANDLRQRIPVNVGNGGDGRRETMRPEAGQEEEARTIPVDDGGGSGREQSAAEAQSDTDSEVGGPDESDER